MVGEKFITFEANYKFPKQFLNLMNKGQFLIEPKIIHDIVAVTLSQGWELARNNANQFRKSGFLMDHIFVYMDTNYSGFIVSEADYSAAVERGHRGRGGKMVAGHKYMEPAFNVVRTTLKEKMTLLVNAISKGVRPAIGSPTAPIKSGKPSVAHKTPSRTYAKQKTVTPKGRYYYHPSVGTVKFSTPLTRTMSRTFRKQRIGGQG
jgi:hypothetical protein